jgi:4-diphosphocytidyl-2-C-methyl-D-erythritol kinase
MESAIELTCPAPAKLNLFLHVTGRRPDGYHLLQTLFRFIDLHDTLHFTLRRDGVVRRSNVVEGVVEEQDYACARRVCCKARPDAVWAWISRWKSASR